MINASNYQYITSATTNVIGSTTNRRVALTGIAINKTLTGTLTIKSGSTTIGVIASGTIPGTYWENSQAAIEIQDLQIVNASTEDVTVFYNNL